MKRQLCVLILKNSLVFTHRCSPRRAHEGRAELRLDPSQAEVVGPKHDAAESDVVLVEKVCQIAAVANWK